MMKRAIIAGGTGYLGSVLERHLERKGWQVVTLTRGPSKNGLVHWEGEASGELVELLESSNVVFNFCGKSVNCRYNQKNRDEILDSRVGPTHALAEALAQCARPPPVWVNAASATVYAATIDKPRTEFEPVYGEGFSVEVCRAWEDAFYARVVPGVRKIALRTSFVLGLSQNSPLRTLSRLARIGAGGAIGPGNQMVSWIHEEDFARAAEFLVENEDLGGTFNLSAPAPVANAVFMAAIREAVGRGVGLPTPSWLLKIGAFFLRTESELMLKSRYIHPARLLEERFVFRYPFVDDALADLLAKSEPREPEEIYRQELATATASKTHQHRTVESR